MRYTKLLIVFVLTSGFFCSSVCPAGNSLGASSSNFRNQQGKRVDFARDIQPILKARCYGCHSGDKPKAPLRLDSKVQALRVIIPGNSKDSRLVHRIMGLGGEPQMPFRSAPLNAEQIETIRAWIDQGAPWPDEADVKAQKHWAYIKPVRPQVPAVKLSFWVRNPIDNFILARLEREGLRPSPEAPKETLIRRLSLDLIGLPPTIKEVDDFVADNSPDAYEKVVDRLLASPHFGERWARPWLDLARYADTNGYEKDRRRSIWKYRDWVIDALNRDMPFDQFTVEQIAGDLLAGATVEQRIATGFLRNSMHNEEGGVDQQEALWETIIDRVNTVATVWLATTLACAQCHNHKYDPFTQKEFYQFFAFFNNTDYHFEGNPEISEQKLIEARLELPTPEQEAKRKQIMAEIAELEEKLKAQTPELEAARINWEKSVKEAAADWIVLDPIHLSSSAGSTLKQLEDKSVLVSGENPEKDTYTVVAETRLRGITGFRLEALPDPSLPAGGPGRDPYGNFHLSDFSVELAPAEAPEKMRPVLFSASAVDNGTMRLDQQAKYESRGWRIDATREEVRLARQAVFIAKEPVGFERGTIIKIKLSHESEFGKQGIGRFRLSVTCSNDPARTLSAAASVRHILDIPPNQRTPKQSKEVEDYYRSISPLLKPVREQLAALRAQLDKLGIISTLVMKERESAEPPSTYLRIRGSYLNKGEKVYAGVPAALHPFPEGQPLNRLGLARWLVSPENPLTPRVTVNRIWEQIFGRAVVATSEDFGTQGERPPHPELLDWLATEFIARGWSMKAIIRLIVTSATYRQSSRLSPLLRERDPYNRLLARGPRFRLEAELIRDVALSVSGLLSHRIGGPSVFPYQPDGIWQIPYNDDKWVMSEGEDRYRRGIYTFWRRTSPYPSFVAFDAPSREVCTVRRVRTNTPLQALVTLNDPAFFEAAKGLARRIVTEASDTRSRAIYGFRLCVSRRPKDEEVKQIIALYEKQLERFSRDPSAAKKVVEGYAVSSVTEAEQAAWTVVSNVLLNLDETLTKE
jgi:hypothetical protein